MSATVKLINPKARVLVENLRPGGFSVIYGPAGCGKTVLARWLAQQAPNIVLAEDHDIPYDAGSTYATRAAVARAFALRMREEQTHGIWLLSLNDKALHGASTPGIERAITEVATMVLSMRKESPHAGTVTVRTVKARHSPPMTFDVTFGAAA